MANNLQSKEDISIKLDNAYRLLLLCETYTFTHTVYDNSMCDKCGDIMKGQCNSYGGCIYLDNKREEQVTVSHSEEIKRGIQQLVDIGKDEGLSYILSRENYQLCDQLPRISIRLSEVLKGWGVTLNDLVNVIKVTSKQDLEVKEQEMIRVNAIHLFKLL